MAQTPKSKPKLHYFLYGFGLLVVAFFIYGTLFVHAYPYVNSDKAALETKTEQKASSQNSSSQASSQTSQASPPAPTYTTYPDTGQKVATVLIDPGHGGFDGGNVAGPDEEILEKDLNLTIANKVVEDLRKLNPQIEVKTIRTDDNVHWATTDLEDLNYRLEQQTAQNADYFISLHGNSSEDPSVKGFAFYINPNDPTMNGMTDKIKENLEAIGWTSYFNTIDYERLQVVSMSPIHSTLIELGFMTNPEDLALMTNPEMQDKAAEAIAAAISDYIMANPNPPAYDSPYKASSQPAAPSAH